MVIFHEVDGKQARPSAEKDAVDIKERRYSVQNVCFNAVGRERNGRAGFVRGRCIGVGWDHCGQFAMHKKEGAVWD